MENETNAKLERYLSTFEQLKKKTGDEHTALSILQEIAKDNRMQQVRAERQAGENEAATKKQLEYLKDLGVNVKPGLTKAEASALIDEAVERED